mmetsp:Transcript_9527/g.33731  ORF Transcript_9527/g.33731 Transcript_9527/m.33731 type:complete len:133 (+) Transcript_9527:63-461(+)
MGIDRWSTLIRPDGDGLVDGVGNRSGIHLRYRSTLPFGSKVDRIHQGGNVGVIRFRASSFQETCTNFQPSIQSFVEWTKALRTCIGSIASSSTYRTPPTTAWPQHVRIQQNPCCSKTNKRRSTKSKRDGRKI